MDLFSPLGREHCEYFRLVSIFFFIIFVGAVLAIASGMFGKKPFMWYLFTAATPLVAYYFYRLLFSICQASLV